MIKFYNKIFQSNNSKILLSNFVYLSILQGLNLLLPLITFPYLVRVLGVDYFGLLSFSMALITYFQIVTDYGFNSTATRDISKEVDNKNKQNEIFNDVMSTKLFLVLICFLLMVTVVSLFKIFRSNWLIYFFSFGSVIGQAIFPIWFFQGVQKMRYITILNLCTKVFFTIALFVFVRKQSDYYLVPVFNALGFISAGTVSFYYLKKDFQIRLKLQPFNKIKEQLIKGKFMFLSELKISLFTNTNVLLLGIFAGNTAVGYFTSAEKLARAMGNFQTPISNALFPYISKEMALNKKETIQKVIKITKMGALVFSIIVLLCVMFSNEIITLIYGQKMKPSILLFKILLIIPLASFLDTMFGKLILLNNNKDNLYFRVILWATIINIVLNLLLTPTFKELGTAIVLSFTQIFIVFGMWYYASKEKKVI